ncbi:MAG: ABC transporter permease [Chloroflexi bacterium]|jgi:ABC-2 type transport system permease protein|nr:ABC transporter permease [Chloroflexota bacterium]MBT7081280.1 ABC transporter permease [Chloroflexota bacterium]MBT7289963.1 ABC transporter permease [Chloroflexota bacterium]
MKNLTHIWFIALKDLKLFVTDKTAMFFFVAFPFLFILLFNTMMSGIGAEDERITLHVLTRDDSGTYSQMLLEAYETTEESKLDPDDHSPIIIWLKDIDYATAKQQVEDKTLSGFVAFPKGFSADIETFKNEILAGEKPLHFINLDSQLEVIVDPDNTDQQIALNGVANIIATQMNAMQATMKSTALLADDPTDAINTFFQQLNTGQWAKDLPSVNYQTTIVGDVEAGNPANYVIPGYLVMFTFFAALQGGAQIVQQRQNNTLERMLTSSVSKEAILGGTFLGIFLRGLLQITIFWTLGSLVFNIDLGIAPAAVIIISVLMVLMSSACALMLATLIKTERAADGIATLTALLLAPLGGCWWPLFITPKWMQFIAKITPHAWANNGFNKLMVFGADFSSVVPEMIALLCFAIGFGTIAVLRFRTSSIQ